MSMEVYFLHLARTCHGVTILLSSYCNDNGKPAADSRLINDSNTSVDPPLATQREIPRKCLNIIRVFC